MFESLPIRIIVLCEKLLPYQKWKPEAVNQVKTCNVIANRKRTKIQLVAHKTLHKRVQIEQQEPTINRE